jgi:pilus assembly protein CpaF
MSITEVMGLEGDNVVLEEIFRFQPSYQQSDDGVLEGDFVTTGLMKRSVLFEKARFFGLENRLIDAFKGIEQGRSH